MSAVMPSTLVTARSAPAHERAKKLGETRVYPARGADELQRSRRRDDPHVVPIYDVGEIDGRLYVSGASGRIFRLSEAGDAWEAVSLDDRWQLEQWGDDAEGRAALDARIGIHVRG